MKCISCGADIAAGDKSCQFCGATAPPPKMADSTAEKLQRVMKSTAYQQKDSPERLSRLPKFPAFMRVVPIIVLGVFVAVSCFILIMMLGVAGVLGFAGGVRMGGGVALAPLAMTICPISFIALGVFLILQTTKRMRKFEEAPILSRAAIITGKRTQVSGGSGDSSASTHYFITAEFDDGSRSEFQAMTATLYGKVAENDTGVLFTRDMIAVDFDRVAV